MSTQKVIPSRSAESFDVMWVWSDTKCRFTDSFGRVSPNQREGGKEVGPSRAEEVLSEGAGKVAAVCVEAVGEAEETTERDGACDPRVTPFPSGPSSSSSPSSCDTVVYKWVTACSSDSVASFSKSA